MANRKYAVSTKKGHVVLEMHGEKVTRATIRQFDKLQKMADVENEGKCPHCKAVLVCKSCDKVVNLVDPNAIKAAYDAGMQLMPFLKPKLQAIAIHELYKANQMDAVELYNAAKEIMTIIDEEKQNVEIKLIPERIILQDDESEVTLNG